MGRIERLRCFIVLQPIFIHPLVVVVARVRPIPIVPPALVIILLIRVVIHRSTVAVVLLAYHRRKWRWCESGGRSAAR